MTAGVPGTGIGGLFYLAAALMLPLRGLSRHGRRLPWRRLLPPFALALGVLAGIWATGWLLGWVLGPMAAPPGMTGQEASRHYRNVVRWMSLIAGLGTLLVVLVTVQVARLVVGLRRS